jgi:hypothetical protein
VEEDSEFNEGKNNGYDKETHWRLEHQSTCVVAGWKYRSST